MYIYVDLCENEEFRVCLSLKRAFEFFQKIKELKANVTQLCRAADE